MGRKGNFEVSGSDFKDPLLITLGRLSDFRAGVAVFHKDTYAPICTLMEIEEGRYGTQDGTNALWVHRWVGDAMKALKGDGLTEQGAKRGRWQLSEEGLQAALRLAEERGLETVPTSTNPEESGDSEVAPLEMPQPTDEYHHDPYLRSLALAETPCRGNYSSRSQTCKCCPLQQSCRNLMAIELSALAATMRKEALQEQQRQKLREKNKALAAEARPENADRGSIPLPDVTSEEAITYKGQQIIPIEAAIESVCMYGCGEPIHQGDKSYYIAGDGCYHPECLQRKKDEEGE